MGRRSRKKKSDIEARGVDENEVDDSEEYSIICCCFKRRKKQPKRIKSDVDVEAGDGDKNGRNTPKENELSQVSQDIEPPSCQRLEVQAQLHPDSHNPYEHHRALSQPLEIEHSDAHDSSAYDHPHAAATGDELLIRTQLERDKYMREVKNKEHAIKESEEIIIGLQRQLKSAQKSRNAIQEEKKELEKERDKLAKKLKDLELMGNVEITEVRKEKERVLAEAKEAIKRERKKKEDLLKELNDMEAEKTEQLQLQKERVDDMKGRLVQKDEDILLAQAETATERKKKEELQEQLLKEKEEEREERERLQRQLEDLKTEHEMKLREQGEKHKELKSEVERLAKAETLRQSEVPDIGGTKREAELERELGIQKEHVTNLQEKIATMREGLQEERIKTKNKEKLHKQELERERAQVKALTDARANLERKHKQEVARLKEQLTEAKQMENEIFALKQDNDKTMKELAQKEAEMTHLRLSIEEQRTEKDNELTKVKDERTQTVSQLHQKLQAQQSTIANLEEQLGVKNLEIEIYKQDFDTERKDRENAHSKVAVLEVNVMELTAKLADKETELAEARKESKKLRNKSKELEQGETDRVKVMEEEIQVLTAQVNAYSREVDKQKGLVTQSQEKHKTEVNELNERFANELKSKQELDNELARMRQQLTNVSANKEELLRAYNKEQAMVTSLEQQLHTARKELARAKEESAKMKNANETLSAKLKSLRKEVSPGPKHDHRPYNRHHDIKQTNEGPQSLDSSISLAQHSNTPYPHSPPYQQHPQSTNVHISNVHHIPIVSADGGREERQYQEKDRRRDEPRRLHHNASDSNILDQPGAAANYRPRSHSNETERQRLAQQRRRKEEEEERRWRQHEEMRRQEEEARRRQEEETRRREEDMRRERERDEAEEAERIKVRQEADRALRDVDHFRSKDAHRPPRSPLASSQNAHKRKHQEPVATQEREEKPKKKGKQHKTDDDSDSDIEENKLIDNIDEEIQQMAEDVRKGSRGPTTAEVLFDDGDSSLPYDPNLVCPKCGKQYRVGEIQKLRRHINEFCTGMR